MPIYRNLRDALDAEGPVEELELKLIQEEDLSDLGRLTALKRLKLYNEHNGPLPPQLADLPPGLRLELKVSSAAGLAGLEAAAGIQALEVRSKRRLVLPAALFTLTGLEVLFLERNKITALPDAIGQLTQLRELSLVMNKLRSLPMTMVNLQALEVLHLHYNFRLERLAPSVIYRLGALRELHAAQCGLDYLEPGISALTNLRVIRLPHNHLAELPDDICDLPHLEDLRVPNNRLERLPERLGELPELKSLNFHTNRLTVLPQSLRAFTEGRSLGWLAKNPLTAGR